MEEDIRQEKGEAAKEGKFRTRIKREEKYLVPGGYEKKRHFREKECCPFALVQDFAPKSQVIPRWSQYGYWSSCAYAYSVQCVQCTQHHKHFFGQEQK